MFSLKMTTYNKILVGYWCVVPICFYSYLFMMSKIENSSMTALITTIPGITVTCLITSLMLIQAVMIHFIQQISSSQDGLLGKFLNFSMIQQLLTVNIIGVFICLVYKRSLYKQEEKVSWRQKTVVIVVCSIVALVSLLSVFVSWRLRNG